MHGTTLTPYPLKFNLIPKKRIWGGQKLSHLFPLNDQDQIGEVWTLSDHPQDRSICVNGPLQGQSISAIVSGYPQYYLGDSWSEGRFPLLIKFIDAADDLSVQVHPDDTYSLTHEQEYGKTEAWYVLGAEPGAKIILGHHFNNTEHFYSSIEQRTVPSHLKYRDVHPDDFVFIPSRTLHALMKGTMVLEIQQTSDVTYRVYDWDRLDQDGNPRELHINKAADVMSYGVDVETPQRYTLDSDNILEQFKLLECPYFSMEKLTIDTMKGQSEVVCQSLGKRGNPDILIVIEGEGALIGPSVRDELAKVSLNKGDTVLVPANWNKYEIATKQMTLIKTYY